MTTEFAAAVMIGGRQLGAASGNGRRGFTDRIQQLKG